VTIREINIDELPALEPLAKAFYASSRFLRGLDMGRAIAAWAEFIKSGCGTIFAMFHLDMVIGAIGCIRYPDIYSGEPIATEFFWYVFPQHRGQGLNLYYRFEQWARDTGCRQIRMAHLCDVMPDGMSVLYRELGYEPMETNYVKELS